MQKKKTKWIFIILLACTVIAAGLFLHVQICKKQERQQDRVRIEAYVRLQQEAAAVWKESAGQVKIGTISTDSENFGEPVYDFDELHKENQDIYAWLTVPGTAVDYPVLQHETDNYYLLRNLDGSQGHPGCIYTNKCNAKAFTDYNTILYGHNMRAGTMFAGLHDFEDETFFKEHDTILVYTPEVKLTYQIYAAFAFSNAYIPAYYDVKTMEGQEKFLEAIGTYLSREGNVREGLLLTPRDQLITLSTCVKGDYGRRYLVIGKLVKSTYYKKVEGK